MTQKNSNLKFRPMLKFAAATAGLCALAVGNVSYAGDPVQGKVEAQVCASCHTITGNSDNATFPKLAGQHESYLINSLTQYRDGANPPPESTKGGIATKRLVRKNAIMAGFASQLTDKQIKDLAAWFASQESDLNTPVNWAK